MPFVLDFFGEDDDEFEPVNQLCQPARASVMQAAKTILFSCLYTTYVLYYQATISRTPSQHQHPEIKLADGRLK
jgi:hypothetical protein